MKKLLCTLIVVALVPFLGTGPGLKAQDAKPAQAGFPFLKIDVGERAAMAGTQIGITGDAMAVFANPAGLGLLEGIDAMISHTSWIAGITHLGAAAAMNLGNLGIIGVSYIQMDYGTFNRTIPNETIEGYEVAGTFEVKEFAVGVTYSRAISSQFFVGGQLKLASQDLGEVEVFDEINNEIITASNKISNVVIDFGTLYYPGWKDFRFGMSLRNFSSQANYYDQRFELPITFDFGVAADLLQFVAPDMDNMKLTVAFDWVHPRDFSERQHVGFEFAYLETLFLRGGYKFNYDEEGLSAGIGIQRDLGGVGLKVNFVYTDFGIFDPVTRVSVGVYMK